MVRRIEVRVTVAEPDPYGGQKLVMEASKVTMDDARSAGRCLRSVVDDVQDDILAQLSAAARKEREAEAWEDF